MSSYSCERTARIVWSSSLEMLHMIHIDRRTGQAAPGELIEALITDVEYRVNTVDSIRRMY